MGRLLTRKYVLEGDLVALTPVHVGSAFGDLVADMPLARDGAGRFYIPGTSLAGPIRRWWIAATDGATPAESEASSDAKTVFGRIPKRNETVRGPDGKELPGPDGKPLKLEGHASFVVVDDAPVIGTPEHEVRDGVGIDRATGAAAEGIKYDRDVLPRGTRFRFRAEIDVWGGAATVVPSRSGYAPPKTVDDDAVKARLGALVRALETGRIRFGAAKTRGLGRLRLEKTKAVVQSIGTRDGLLARLGQKSGAAAGEPLALDRTSAAAKEIAITIAWRPALPVMNKSEVEGVSIDALPLVTRDGTRLQPVITGASVKGVLRTHAERVCRTLAGLEPGEGVTSSADRKDFLDDLAACELIEALFGAAGKADKRSARAESDKADDDDPKGSPIPGLGALAVDDCLIDAPITPEVWRELLTTKHDESREEKTGAIRRLLDADGFAWNGFRPATHVAIDRWTGAAADGLLFSGLEPSTDGGRSFALWLDLDRIAPRPKEGRILTDTEMPEFRRAAFALLLVTLRDLARGRIPIGWGVTRGLGSITVERIAFEVAKSAAADLKIAGVEDDGVVELGPDDFSAEEKMKRFTEVASAWTDYWSRDAVKDRCHV